jgi:hypothetical protein
MRFNRHVKLILYPNIVISYVSPKGIARYTSPPNVAFSTAYEVVDFDKKNRSNSEE